MFKRSKFKFMYFIFDMDMKVFEYAWYLFYIGTTLKEILFHHSSTIFKLFRNDYHQSGD